MRVEVLYPEIAHGYGENATITYFQRHFKTHMTSLDETPYFVKEKVDLIYLGPISRSYLHLVVEALKPYSQKLQELISEDQLIIAVGNGVDVFLKESHGYGQVLYGLGLIDAKVIQRDNPTAFLSLDYKWEKIIARTFDYGEVEAPEDLCFLKHPEQGCLGLQKFQFYGLRLLGPVLLHNPNFTKLLLSEAGIELETLPLEEKLKEIYVKRSLRSGG